MTAVKLKNFCVWIILWKFHLCYRSYLQSDFFFLNFANLFFIIHSAFTKAFFFFQFKNHLIKNSNSKIHLRNFNCMRHLSSQVEKIVPIKFEIFCFLSSSSASKTFDCIDFPIKFSRNHLESALHALVVFFLIWNIE